MKISKELEKVSSLRTSLAKEDEEKKQKAENLINNAKIEARNILISAKEEASKALKLINSSSYKDINI